MLLRPKNPLQAYGVITSEKSAEGVRCFYVPIQLIDPHATMTDEEHAILFSESNHIYEDFEVGLDEVRKVNIDGTTTSETLYVKFTDVFETRFSGCKDIKLMRYFKVFSSMFAK